MSVVPMKKIHICAIRSDRKDILERLQLMGIIQPRVSEDSGESDIDFGHFRFQDTALYVQQFKKNSEKLDQALEALDKFAPEKKPILASMLGGKEPVSKEDFIKAINSGEKTFAFASRVLDLKKSYDDLAAEIGDLKGRIESLTPWVGYDIPLSWTGTEHTACFTGSFGRQADESELTENITSLLLKTPTDKNELSEAASGGAQAAEIIDEAPAFSLRVISSDKNQTCVSVLCHKDDSDSVLKVLRQDGFIDFSSLTRTNPSDAVKCIKEQIDEKEKKMEDVAEKIKGYADKREDFKVLSDYFRIRSQKYETVATIPQTDNVFLLSGFISAKDADRVKAWIEDKYTASVEIEDPAEDEDVPVLLHNNRLASSVEGILSSYGLPTKQDIDPTAIMYWFYVVFFGLMLSDAAYGLIMTIATAAVLIAFPRMGDGMRKSMKMFCACGISTTIWGFLFGGFFGDVITVVSSTFFGHEVSLRAIWFVPLEDPMRMLLYSLLFGIIHLYTGLGIKAYTCLRDRQIEDFIGGVLAWFLFTAGLILVLISSDFFYGIASFKLNMPQAALNVCIGIAVAGAVLLLLFGGRSSKNPVLRLLLGAYEIYGVTSWLSDILSYSRLLALGLATGVIAQVVNQIGSMFGNGLIGIILFIIIFLFGHILNFAINALGAYVHTNRLQYVEFFGKFYESGGSPFKPFISDTKYVDIESKED